MRLTLSPESVCELTGLVQSAAQIRWLDKYGWKYAADQRGRPVIDRRYYDMRMGMAESVTTEAEPNFGALYA